MPPPLREATAREIVQIVSRAEQPPSFSEILLAANQQGILSWHRTLRRYLDLLVEGKLLTMRKKDVGSVNPQQLYRLSQKEAHLLTGLTVLSQQGLNWDMTEEDTYTVKTDLAALVRARKIKIGSEERLVSGLEDTLAYELERDAREQNGTAQLVASMIATRPLDLAYLLRRADLLYTGQSTRALLQKITDTFKKNIPPAVDGRSFLETRARFLKIEHLYRNKGTLKIVSTKGQGTRGLDIVQNLTPDEIVYASAKQLGVTG